jgi:hypothetical protein
MKIINQMILLDVWLFSIVSSISGCGYTEVPIETDQPQVLDASIGFQKIDFAYTGGPFGGTQIDTDLYVAVQSDAKLNPNQTNDQSQTNDQQTDLSATDMTQTPDQSIVIDMTVIDQAIPNPLAMCPKIKVVNTGVDGLKLRPEPNRNQPQILIIPDQTILDVISIESNGEEIMGNNDWFEVSYHGSNGFVSAYFTTCLSAQELTDLAQQAQEDFLLPFACGTRHRVTQGNNGSVSHMGRTAYAFDFALGLNTPILAMKSGVVRFTRDSTNPGDNCYNGGGPECRDSANYVVLQHIDGTGSAYVHLNRVDVQVGQRIAQGDQLGLSGSTGYSTGPHGHIERQVLCDSRFCQSIELRFADVSNGIPQEGDTVTSGNCH